MTDRITTKIPAGGRSVPSIAAVIPLYNGARYIEEALRSVLSQRLKPAEIIVINDGSTDDGPAIVERMAADHPITLLHKENGGQSSARNLGIRHCSSDLIALLDQDDAWYPNHLEKLVQPFMRPGRMELGWAYSNLDEIDENGHVVRLSVLDGSHARHPKDSLFDCLSRDMFILPSASLISRKAFLDIGAFDEALSGYEDDDLFVRLFHAGYDHRYIPAALSRWRIYSTSTSFSPRMARSRMIFARKLMRTFPDDPFNNRFYTRDLIAPRFLDIHRIHATHEHIGMIYFARPAGGSLALAAEEHLDIRWCTAQGLDELDPPLSGAVKWYCLKALEEVPQGRFVGPTETL